VVLNAHDVMSFAYAKLSHFVDLAKGCHIQPGDYRLPPLHNLRQARLRYNPLRNLLIRRICRLLEGRVTCSESLRQALHANALPPFQVVPYGIDPATMQADPQAVSELRQRLNLGGRKVILFAGRLSTGKGSLQTLAALKQVIAQIPEAALLTLTTATAEQQGIAGPEFAALREKHIVQGGWLAGETLAAAYHLADVVIFPSIAADPFGLINLEGMAAGKPVIATCFGGAPEVVIDGKTGFVINPLDTALFADRLLRLLADPDLRRQMGRAGRERFLQRYTLDRYAADMEAVYTAAIQAKAGKAR
jgi:glycosyltransferase involved in cell wall biosynthesis